MTELFLLAVASAFWPALLAVTLVSLRAAHPVRLLVSFLAGGLLTTMTVGLVVIYGLNGSVLLEGSRPTFDPVVEITVGALALFAAWLLRRRLPAPVEEAEAEPVEEKKGRIERMLDRGAPLAFLAGIVLCVVPGVFPIAALKNIAEMGLGVAETVSVLLGFYLIMFAFIELPLVGYIAAPGLTARSTRRFNAWLDRNARRMGIVALAAVGLYLVVKGLFALVN